jgi:hypothetical protein
MHMCVCVKAVARSCNGMHKHVSGHEPIGFHDGMYSCLAVDAASGERNLVFDAVCTYASHTFINLSRCRPAVCDFWDLCVP